LARFQAPSFLEPIDDPAHHQLDQSVNSVCPQVQVPSSKTSSYDGPNLGDPILAPPEDAVSTEDCLYLDLYVPISAIGSNASSLPVIVWFYGGAFLIGSKDAGGSVVPFYSGLGPIGAAQSLGQNAIFIAGNYRLGAFGWLAGPEFTTAGGAPNAGLLDQRLLLKWVQKNIGLFGGSSSQVSAWGQSAGGGSIMHHMTATWNDEYPGDPLFKRAILMSAAYQWQWNSTNLDNAYNQFLSDANCTSFSCLEGLSTLQLAGANQQLFASSYANGVFDVGPSVDGELITELPPIALTSCTTNCMYLNHFGNQQQLT
jgi:carboxylesterase type B